MKQSGQEPFGRRPLKTRQWPVFQRLASRLADRGVTPNSISVASIVFGILAGILLAATSKVESELSRRALWFMSAMMIQMRLIANLLDGMVAIEGGKKSPVGDLYNEVPDRLSDPAIFIGAGFAWGGCDSLGFSAALVSLFVAYVRAIGASVGAGQIYIGPFAKQQRMAIMTGCCVLSCLLPTSLQTISSAWNMGLIAISLAVIVVGGIATAVRRLLRIAKLMRERQEGSP